MVFKFFEMIAKDPRGFALVFIYVFLVMMIGDTIFPIFRFQPCANSTCKSSKITPPAPASYTKSKANARKNSLNITKVIASQNVTSRINSTKKLLLNNTKNNFYTKSKVNAMKNRLNITKVIIASQNVTSMINSTKKLLPNNTKNDVSQNSTTSPPRLKSMKKLYLSFLGRLGNMLFEITGLYALKLETKSSQMYFKDNGISPKIIQMFPMVTPLLKTVNSLPPGLVTVSERRGGEYDTTLAQRISAAKSDVLVAKYLEVSQYWRPKYEKEIKDFLTISITLKQEARELLFDIANKKNVSLETSRDSLDQWTSPKLETGQPTLVGIQVRRGDKVNANWVLPNKGYFSRAMDHFRAKYKHVYFIVVSEDKNWAKQNILGPDVIYSTSSSDILELTLLSLCDHTIMSVGTFSWWAAYLAGGDVVYFKDHIPKHSPAYSFYNDTQYFLSDWKPML